MNNKNIIKFLAGALFGVMLSFAIYSLSHMYLATHDQANLSQNELDEFNQVFSLVKNYYVESLTDSNIMTDALKGMLSNLDPHSEYLDQDSYKDLTNMTTGEFGGIGIEVNASNSMSGIEIIAPIDGTPAYRAGIKNSDVITKVNESSIIGQPVDKVIKTMRGAPGTQLKLTIIRAGDLLPLHFTLTREIIKVNSVKFTMLPSKNAYLRINSFQNDTVTDLVNALKDINKKQPHLHGLILDLRDNPGGLLQAAVGSAGAFLTDESLIVYTKGRVDEANVKYYNSSQYYSLDKSQNDILNQVPAQFKHIPMVILINHGSASAAEIVSGALQDYRRGTLIGTKSFGKGSVQSLIPLSANTGVKFTTALYFTPKGRSIQAEGIYPNIVVKSIYSTLLDNLDLSEKSLNKHLNNPNQLSITHDNDKNVPVITPPKQVKTQDEFNKLVKQKMANQPKVLLQSQANIDLKNDFQLQWAIKILDNRNLPITISKAIIK